MQRAARRIVAGTNLPLHRDHLYIADGCGQRAVYAPYYTWPGPGESGFILIAISKRPP